MKTVTQFLNESKFKYSERYEVIQDTLKGADAKSRKYYIEKLNSMTFKQLDEIENAVDHEGLKFVNSEMKRRGDDKWDKRKELDIMINTLDAMIDQILNGTIN